MSIEFWHKNKQTNKNKNRKNKANKIICGSSTGAQIKVREINLTSTAVLN